MANGPNTGGFAAPGSSATGKPPTSGGTKKKPKKGYQFIDDAGRSYNVRNLKGVRTRLYANGRKVVAPKPISVGGSSGGTAAPSSTSSTKPIFSVKRFRS